jgi:7-cyano-7-deazaguanine synthase
VPFKTIKLEWLKDITTTALVNTDISLPEYSVEKLDSSIDVLNDSAKSVWVPNRNGVMLNIAAAHAESIGAGYIMFGANLEEATTFPDNTKEFADALTESLYFSTANNVKVVVPLANKSKNEIVAVALRLNIPLNLIWSCYNSSVVHCGQCESCSRLKRALIDNDLLNVWKEISV